MNERKEIKMLLHLTPKFYLRYSNVDVGIVDVTIPELGIALVGQKDIAIRTPYPNKNYKVVCRKKGRKAISGIFINAPEQIQNFTMVTRWVVDGDISVHKIHYNITDTDFDAASDDIMLWSGVYGTAYENRHPLSGINFTPASAQPRMVTFESDNKTSREEVIFNVCDKDGYVRSRTEYFEIPTLERQRVISPFRGRDRVPDLNDAFEANFYDKDNAIKPNEFKDFGILAVPLSEWIQELKGEFDDGRHLFIEILNEINNSSLAQSFYSNTNDLIIKARLFSHTYSQLDDDKKKDVDYFLNQPIFHLSVGPEDADE